MQNVTRGQHLAHSISFALSKAQKFVRGLWFGLTDKERWDVACKTVDHLKEHGDKWKLNEELESPVVEAHSSPRSLRKHMITRRTDLDALSRARTAAQCNCG